jgi:molybdopterin-guanine dinucleotide biosynthesis protein A
VNTASKYPDITGIILAGGKSRRMGSDKAFLPYGGITLIEHTIRKLEPLFGNISIIADETDAYQQFGLPVYSDIIAGAGPLGGLHSGLTHSHTEQNFVIGCDTPLISVELIRMIVEYKTDKSITVIRHNEFVEPLAARYSKKILPALENILSRGTDNNVSKSARLSLHHLFEQVPTEFFNPSRIDGYSVQWFSNVNNINDYIRLSENELTGD